MKPLYLLFFLTTVGLTSCINENLNIDPNRPSAVPTSSLIVTVQKQLTDNVRGEAASLRSSALFVQQLSQVTYTSQSRYDIPFTYSADVWSGLYGVLNNLQAIIQLNTDDATKGATANDGGRNATQIAISRVLTVYTYAALTDIFGNVPYHSYGSSNSDFQALQQHPENITPRYATQEQIYTDMLNELKQAGDTLLKYSAENTFGTSDIIYNGNNAQWAKFAHSLRLRLATRFKTKNSALYQSHAADALQQGIFTSNADNAVYKYSVASPNEAPYYRATVTVNRRDYALSKPFVELLQGKNAQLPIADPRLSQYAAKNERDVYEGLPYGLTEAQAGAFAATDVSLPGALYSAANFGEALLEYSEVEFLLSEYNNWSQDHYVSGVKASLEKWGVSTADADAYVAQLPPANQRNVLNQKYIALFTQFLEAWSDYRRTGYPDFLIKKDDIIFAGEVEGKPVTYTFTPLFGNGGVPARLYYPVKEQTVNLENYRGAIQIQGNDVIETPLWIFK